MLGHAIIFVMWLDRIPSENLAIIFAFLETEGLGAKK